MKVFVSVEIRDARELWEPIFHRLTDGLVNALKGGISPEDQDTVQPFVENVILWPFNGYVTKQLQAIYSAQVGESREQTVELSPMNDSTIMEQILAIYHEHLTNLEDGHSFEDNMFAGVSEEDYNRLVELLDRDMVEFIHAAVSNALQKIREVIHAVVVKQTETIHLQILDTKGAE